MATAVLQTARLVLQPPSPALAAPLLGFYTRNAAHLAPWDPPQPPGFLTVAFQRELLRLAAADARRGTALLQRLGFEREGVARDYLYIDGQWRDHVMHARRNPAFRFPPESTRPEPGALARPPSGNPPLPKT